jgi:hypothetical protein
MGPGGEAWMFPEALDLEGSEAQEGRGSDGAFVAVKGELILIWRRFGRIERCRLHAGELERVVSVILPPDPTLTCATASTCSRARASGADAAKLGHETHQNTSKLAARLVYRIFLRDLRSQRSGGKNAYTRYLPRENYSTKRETDLFFLPSSPGHGHGVSASYPNMFEPKDCVFRSTTNTHALSISAEWKMRQLYTFFVRIAFGVLIGGTILFLRRVELKMKFLF